MTSTEAAAAVALLRELWPSKFHWTPAMVALWLERLTRPEWSAAQVEAVIRQSRAEDDTPKPSIKRLVARIWDAHGGVKAARKPESQAEPDTSPADDRLAARAWYAGLSDTQLATVVERASAAVPFYAGQWARHITDLKYQPTDTAMLMLKAAHRVWGERGAAKRGPLVA